MNTISGALRSVAFFHGPWYVTPSEIAHAPNRLFYKQEVFLSSIEDTNPLLSVVGKCCVLDYSDYTSCESAIKDFWDDFGSFVGR